jgi:hypothetical protein
VGSLTQQEARQDVASGGGLSALEGKLVAGEIAEVDNRVVGNQCALGSDLEGVVWKL